MSERRKFLDDFWGEEKDHGRSAAYDLVCERYGLNRAAAHQRVKRWGSEDGAPQKRD